MAAQPPPWRWHADTQLSSPIQQSARASHITNVETVAAAWKNVTNVVRDDWRPVQLVDLLTNAVRETQYSFQPAGVGGCSTPEEMYIPPSHTCPTPHSGHPCCVRVCPCSTRCRSLCWIDTMHARQCAFAGSFPSSVVHGPRSTTPSSCGALIAGASCKVLPGVLTPTYRCVDTHPLSLFPPRNDVPIEYCGEEQAIVAVGLATPKPHVFVEAIHHILVICTTVEVVLLGVCSTGGNDDIALQPLPLYAIASDNVTMTCVATTPEGRIFLGGADGHVYELLYSANDSWRQKRCTKVCFVVGGVGVDT